MTSEKIRVLIADDHDFVRKNIRQLLERQQDIEVIGTAVNGYEAVEMAQAYDPQVIVMDISMPELDGIRAAEQIHSLHLSCEVIILSMHVNAVLVKRALETGVKGYVLKQQSSSELPRAVRSVSKGKLYIDNSIPAAYVPGASP